MIEISNLTKTYKGSNVKAVDDISFTVQDGCIFGFLGPNGAGKSTTIKCLTGIHPFDGNIRVGGIDMREDPVGAKKKIGFVPDEHIIYDGLTGADYVNFIADIFGIPSEEREARVKRLADMFGMSDKLGDLISSYSHGMKQKITVIAALVHDPDVWILDEPMTGLDPQSSYSLKVLMREHADKGKVVFFSSHVLEVVEKICDKVAIIDKGKLITVCDMSELKEKKENLSLEELFLNLTGGEQYEMAEKESQKQADVPKLDLKLKF